MVNMACCSEDGDYSYVITAPLLTTTYSQHIGKRRFDETATYRLLSGSYHIICKIYSAPITLYKTMGALHSS